MFRFTEVCDQIFEFVDLKKCAENSLTNSNKQLNETLNSSLSGLCEGLYEHRLHFESKTGPSSKPPFLYIKFSVCESRTINHSQ